MYATCKAHLCTVAHLYIYSIILAFLVYLCSLGLHPQTNRYLLADSNVLAAWHVLVLSYIEPDHAIVDMNELPMLSYTLWMSCLR